MKTTRILLIISTLLTFNSALAKTIIVSDVDDTIKISHVGDKSDMALYATAVWSRFKGMSPLYHNLKEKIAGEPEIKYLTNAPESVMRRIHTKFLEVGNFPQGDILFRKSLLNSKHKINSLNKLLSNDPSIETFILIGDNTEHDIDVYNQFCEENKNKITCHQYIRIINNYSHTLKLKGNQVGFILPLEISIDLCKKAVVECSLVQSSLTSFLNDMLFNGVFDQIKFTPMYFPSWQTCGQHKMTKGLDPTMDQIFKIAYIKTCK